MLCVSAASCFSLSLWVYFPIPPPTSRWPHASISFGGPSSPGRGHVSSTAGCTICSGLGTNARTHIQYIHSYVRWQAGEACIQQRASFLSIPRTTKHVSPLSAALPLAMVSTFDTLMCVTLTNRTWQCSNSWLRSNMLGTVCASLLYCGHLRLPLFVSVPLVRLSVSLSVWGRFMATAMLLRLWPRWQKESTSRLAQNSHDSFDTLFSASTHLPLVNKLLLALRIQWMGRISCLRKS